MVVRCEGSCKQPVKVAYQERMFKSPLLLITCKTPGCSMRHATMAVERIGDYPQHAAEFLEKDRPRQLALEVK